MLPDIDKLFRKATEDIYTNSEVYNGMCGSIYLMMLMLVVLVWQFNR